MEKEKNTRSFANKANSLMPLILVVGAVTVFGVAVALNLQDSNVVRDTIQTLSTGAIALARGGRDDD